QVAANIPFEPPVAIATNSADGSIWALTQKQLAHLSEQGTVQFAVSLRDLGNGLGAPRSLVLNPNDGSVWALFENQILHLNAAGTTLHAVAESVRDFALGQDGSVWLLDRSAVRQYDQAGVLLRNVPVDGQRFRHLALDDAGGFLWLAGEKELVQARLSAPAQATLSILAPETIAGISADLQTGDVWVIGQNSLFAYGRDGSPRVSRDLRDFGIANPRAVLFDFLSQAAWVGHSQGITRVTVAGTVAAAFPAAAQVATIAIGRAPVSITPVVSIVTPADGALLNTAKPELRVDYDALCGTTPCGFPNSFFSSFTLSALLNGTESGSSFVFDPATGGATFTPSARLPEGLNTFSAKARDSFGRFSQTVTSTFTIDTIPPSFVNVTPQSGSLFSVPSISISGSVDDAAATVTLGGQAPQGQNFSFSATLNEGSNTLTLIARDPAGNTALLPLTYVYEKPNVPPSVAITSPAGGASFTAPASIEIGATATDSDGSIVRVEFFTNGVLAVTDTTAPYTASLAGLGAGNYSFTARATDNRGGVTTSAPVGITVFPPNAPPVVQLTVAAGNPPIFAPASVQVSASASDTDGTVTRVEFLRNGVVEATDTDAPYAATLTNIPAGTHSITARATDDTGGATTSAPATITITAPSIVIDSPLPNASIAGDTVLVKGHIVAPPFSGVRVNEYPASIDAAGNFIVLVPANAGPNTLIATLTMMNRANVTQTIGVNASGSLSQFVVETTATTGFAPLVTTFTISNPLAGNATFTFDGNGPFFLQSGGTFRIGVTYPAGVYAPTIVFSSNGQLYTHRIVIDSRDPAQTDAMFKAMWNGMNDALLAGNKDAALGYFTDSAQLKYGPVFDTLLPFMSEIVGSYSPVVQSSVGEELAEYALTRLDGGIKRLYLISFMRDQNGVWRIDGM
ncbi:MAG: hypothetical protein QOJ98_2687, partial [Acidobacteriota bacterium]|nr:hypothetical protein [Acidobacteriota bacterium]